MGRSHGSLNWRLGPRREDAGGLNLMVQLWAVYTDQSRGAVTGGDGGVAKSSWSGGGLGVGPGVVLGFGLGVVSSLASAFSAE